MKKVLSIALCLLMAVSFFGCGMSTGKEVNLRDKISSLMASDNSLALKGKYNALGEIKDGSVDKDIVGTWKTADGETTYTYNEDGTSKAETKDYGSTEAKFTCIAVNEYKVLCEEVPMESTDENGKTVTTTVVSYSTYSAENDALYIVPVEDTTDENMDSSQYAVISLYRTDDSGSIDAALAKNKVSLETYNGTWKSEKGEFTIADGTLTVGKDSYDISIDDKNQLVVEKDDASTAYSASISVRKQYDSEDKTKATETTSMSIYYTGEDGKDVPNLASVIDDWHADYGWETYYYSGTFDLQ
ncbi:MAG: hypothetical protein IJR60_06850 [Eubacterium sp.]|nr:hypothetical protein [Eubacterium sp.]